MLTKLSIQNYALIDDIAIEFGDALTTITGETGAGKSILLGGLGLILGNRAVSKVLMDPNKKCIIEGEFSIEKYQLDGFFKKNDIDYEDQTIIRRELLPSGKSRAFINDTPVRLDLLSKLQNQLVDVHSQHQTLQLNDVNFQFKLLDALANTTDDLLNYRKKLKDFNRLSKDFDALKESIQMGEEQHEYHLHLYEELERARFEEGEQERIEQELERVNNIELIQRSVNESFLLISNEENGLSSQLYSIKSNLEKIKSFGNEYEDLYKRISSLVIELSDIEEGLYVQTEKSSKNPELSVNLNNRLQVLMGLYQKHKVSNISELLEVENSLSEKVSRIQNADTLLDSKAKEIELFNLQLRKDATAISAKRKAVIPDLELRLQEIVQNLGMPDAKFQISLHPTKEFTVNGIDILQIGFTANKGTRLGSINQIASGGELSRIMLAFKSIIALHSQLPTIIFDEIDSGISGEIAIKMAKIMQDMSKEMQVICITHLPQIAAYGNRQMKVFKVDEESHTHTDIRLLNHEERVLEIAEMLGGKNTTKTAINHAKQLLE